MKKKSEQNALPPCLHVGNTRLSKSPNGTSTKSVHFRFAHHPSDYELRRELIRIGAARSLAHLDELCRELEYLPVTTSTWRTGARLWALVRQQGRPGADGKSFDGDMLIAAQARTENATVVTTNARHFTGIAETATLEDF